ncbi:MAG: hypothetical protein Q7K34_01745 [archaeon]|nr:hypothetical protein [archaeon]
MDRKILLVGVILSILVSVGFAVSIATKGDLSLLGLKVPDKEELQVVNAFKENGETIEIVQTPTDQIAIASRAMPSTESELLAFKQKSVERLNLLSTGVTYQAIVTFSKELNEEELKELSKIVSIYRVKFVSFPEGTGAVEFPVPETYFEELEQRINSMFSDKGDICSKEVLATKGEAAKKQCDSYKNYKALKGFIAADTIVGSKEQLMNLARTENVLVVDVGPVELLQQYPGAFIMPTKDIWYEYSKITNS